MPALDEILTAAANRAPGLALAFFTLMFAFLVSHGGKRVVNRLADGRHIAPAMAGRVQTLRRWTVWPLALLIVLQLAGLFDHAWALISAIAAAIAVAFFATWSVLSNATGALLVLTFRPYRIGDHVELVEPSNGTASAGRVIDMNLMFTVLEGEGEDGAKHLLHVPNNLVFQKLVRVHTLAAPEEPFYPQADEP